MSRRIIRGNDVEIATGAFDGRAHPSVLLVMGTVRNSVRWAMMMKRRESSHGYRERTSGPAPGWT
ncbi:hypothetical protein DA101_025635 [Sinorhizobium meliloti]|nr:hypothetical protein DA101_025635 [Sinorhizobium meliloti]